MDKKIMFINPVGGNNREYGFSTPPIGLTYLSAIAKEEGFLPHIYDMQLPGNNENRMLKILSKIKFQIICITLTTMNYHYTKHLIPALRKLQPDAMYICGGPHPTVRPEETLQIGFDMVVIGEGEETFREILANNKKQLPGTAIVEKGKILINPSRKRIKDLDSLPMPDLETFGFPRHYTQYSQITSRGCPHACNFCSSKNILGRVVMNHSPKRVIAELRRAIVKYGQTKGVFVDDTMNLNPKRFDKILDGIIKLRNETGVDFRWSFNSRIDSGERTDWKKVKKAGGTTVSFGIEAGSKALLESVEKGISLDKILPVIRAAKHAGLDVRTTWVVGLPGPYEEQLKSVELMEKLSPYVSSFSVHNLLPLPGTAFWDKHKEYGIQFNEKKLMKYMSFNKLPPKRVLKFDYMDHSQMIDIFQIMEDTLILKGFDRPGKATKNIIRTPINRQKQKVEPILK